jgi:hypothetical protein
MPLSLPTILTDTAALDGRLTATRAGYLDSVPAILTDTAALDGRLTATRAGKLDNLDASISGIPAAVAAQVGGGMQIRSIQSGQLVASLRTDGRGSAAITSVNIAKSVLVFSFSYSDGTYSGGVRGYFGLSTMIYFYGSGTTGKSAVIDWFVIEYE